MQIKRVLACHNDLGEGPLWSTRDKTLHWLDINQSKIHCYHPDSGSLEIFEMPFRVTALAQRRMGGFICATEKGFHFWNGSNPEMQLIIHPEEGKEGARFNDGKVDRQGRFWAGTMDPRNASSALYRLNTDYSVQHMLGEITISNGIGWSPDNRRMYYADTLRYTIYDFRFDLESGEINTQRVFVRVEPDFGVPDGLTVDSQGFVWVAFYDGWKVVRYKPDGKIDMLIEMPVARPTCPAFGGENLDELYITTAIDGLSPAALEKQPMAGDLFMLKTGIKGLPEPKFAG